MANDALDGPDPAADGCQLPATQAMPVVPRAAELEPDAAARPREAGAPPDATAVDSPAAAHAADTATAADAAAQAIAATGRFRIDELLGEGGMGRVFRAHDKRLRRTVAIKVLAAFDAAASARLAREARLQARVEHPNVAKVYETGETQGVRYIVMQFIPGRPLGEVAAAMSLEQKVRVAQRVAEGLHEAHRLGLVHGDVKPGNVLVVAEADGAAHPTCSTSASRASSPPRG
jgi:serine/threonine-protein kinase